MDITEALKSQMDHILINGKWKSSSPDVKDYRGADVVSVHTLVIRVFSEKLLKTRMQIASWPQYQQKSNDGFRNDGGSVKYQKRNAICKENQKLTKWKEHFDSVLNRREPSEIDEIPEADEYLDISAKPLTLEKTRRGTKRTDLR